MINIVTQPQQVITLTTVEVLAVRDLFAEKTIIARIKNLPRPVILWQGDAEYDAAGIWTNESVLERATQVLSGSAITWG